MQPLSRKKKLMRIPDTDIEALKGYDLTRAYCEAALGQPVRRGRVLMFPCPFGAHTRPHLELADLNGAGITICRSCNAGGSVLDVAAAVLGVDVRRNFTECAREVAEKVGYVLHEEGAEKRTGSRRKRPTPRKIHLTAPQPEKPQELPQEEQEKALRAVAYAHSHPQAMRAHAEALNLPAVEFLFHTDATEAAAQGLLGLDEAGRLLYAYTHREADGVRVLMVKTRSTPEEVARDKPRFLCRGRKQALFGADSAIGAGDVYITEGESDALAVRAAFWQFLDFVAHNAPDDYPAAEDLPAVVAKPDAGTFRAEWAAPLVGSDVTLITDADEAGQNGAQETARKLFSAGVRRVYHWAPTNGAKDARAALDPACPMLLAENILTNRKEINQ